MKIKRRVQIATAVTSITIALGAAQPSAAAAQAAPASPVALAIPANSADASSVGSTQVEAQAEQAAPTQPVQASQSSQAVQATAVQATAVNDVAAPLPSAYDIAPAPDTGTELPAPSSKVPSYILWGAGGGSLLAGAILGVSALAAKSDFTQNPTYDAADRVDGRATAADYMLGLGIVLAVTGTVFYFNDGIATQDRASLSHERHAALQIAPLVSAKAGGAMASLRF